MKEEEAPQKVTANIDNYDPRAKSAAGAPTDEGSSALAGGIQGQSGIAKRGQIGGGANIAFQDGHVIGSNWYKRAGGAAAPASFAGKPVGVRDPNMYLSNGYIGGQGERDRIEKLISEGVMVDGKRVKLEAFTRNYGQAFPIPTREALAVSANTERTRIVEQGDRTFLQVGLQAMKGELPRRPPLNLALVIDCSGSMMDEGKMTSAIAACKRLVQGLNSDDRLAVVRFEDDASVAVASTRASNKRALSSALDNLNGGGGTNIYAGLQYGYKEVAKHAGPDSVNRVILLSDGEVTSGVTDREQFEKLAAGYSDQDIQTTAVGLGLAYNEDLMLAVAREGKGNYHFIKNSADTQTVFDSELNELTHVVAKAVKLRVVLGPDVRFIRALGARSLDHQETAKAKREEKKLDRRIAEELGIPQNRNPDKDEPGIKLLIPTFYRGDNHVVMIEVAVPPGRKSCKIADVYLKYKDLVSRNNKDTRALCSVAYTPHRDEMIASVNRNVKKNLLGFQTGEALIAASELMGQGKYAEAIRKVDERMAVLGVASQQWRDKDLDHDGRLLDSYKSVLGQMSRGTYASGEFGQYLRKSLSYAGYRMTR
jgi:Ca-activated chloride channel family protein